jgi:hypothetical protein
VSFDLPVGNLVGDVRRVDLVVDPAGAPRTTLAAIMSSATPSVTTWARRVRALPGLLEPMASPSGRVEQLKLSGLLIRRRSVAPPPVCLRSIASAGVKG